MNEYEAEEQAYYRGLALRMDLAVVPVFDENNRKIAETMNGQVIWFLNPMVARQHGLLN